MPNLSALHLWQGIDDDDNDNDDDNIDRWTYVKFELCYENILEPIEKNTVKCEEIWLPYKEYWSIRQIFGVFRIDMGVNFEVFNINITAVIWINVTIWNFWCANP